MGKGVNFDVYIFKHDDLLTNVLSALIAYRVQHGAKWPSNIYVKANTRFSRSGMDFGAGTEVIPVNWGLSDAFYFKHGEFLETAPKPVRKATKFKGKRIPVTDIGDLKPSVRKRVLI